MKKRIMQAVACAISVCVAGASASSAQTLFSTDSPPLPQAEWAKDVTVLVIAPDGAWGTATEPFIHQAFARAIANCKNMHRQDIGCGYRFTSVRAGWSLAMRCGRDNIIVAAKALHAAEQAAVDSELNLRRGYKPNLPPCVRVVSVDPHGGIIAPDVTQLLHFVSDR